MANYETCLHILGLQKNAGLNEIKSAYRRKAKQLHPDVNPSSEAQQQFLRLKKAYEYAVMFHGKGKQIHKKETPPADHNKKYGTHKNWNSEENNNYRTEAKERAKKKKEAFLNSDEYKESVLFSTFFNYMALALVWFLGFIMIYAPFVIGVIGWVVSIICFFIGLPMWWAYVKKQYKHLSIREFKNTFQAIKETHRFWIGVFIFTNLFLAFYSTIHTVINSALLIFIYLFAILATKLYCKYSKNFNSVKQNYWAVGFAPFVLNLLFLINFVISFSPSTFTSEYQFHPYQGERNTLEDGLIFMKENKYENELFLRMFFNHESKNSSHITYEVEKGILGLEVIKEYTFSGTKRH